MLRDFFINVMLFWPVMSMLMMIPPALQSIISHTSVVADTVVTAVGEQFISSHYSFDLMWHDPSTRLFHISMTVHNGATAYAEAPEM